MTVAVENSSHSDLNTIIIIYYTSIVFVYTVHSTKSICVYIMYTCDVGKYNWLTIEYNV